LNFFKPPKIYPITDQRLTGLSHAAQVEKLIAGGASFIQLREKHASPRDFLIDAERAIGVARKNSVKIIINDRVDLALVLKADGVHLGQDDLPPAAAREVLGGGAIIGYSTHNLEQAAEAARLPIDYLAIGPVFPTTTKENPDPTIGLATIVQTRAAIGDFPLVAIGGISRDNFQRVLTAGADSLAVISAVLTPPADITTNLQRFLTDSYR
jgi:thiamine-phosphate pyrophosphorylase